LDLICLVFIKIDAFLGIFESGLSIPSAMRLPGLNDQISRRRLLLADSSV